MKIMNMGDTQLAKDVYIESCIRYVILNNLRNGSKKTPLEVYKALSDNNELYYDTPLVQINKVILELVELDLLRVERLENEGVLCEITDRGIVLLQNQTLQSVFATSFFGYNSYKLSRLTVIISFFALGVSLIGIIFSLKSCFC